MVSRGHGKDGGFVGTAIPSPGGIDSAQVVDQKGKSAVFQHGVDPMHSTLLLTLEQVMNLHRSAFLFLAPAVLAIAACATGSAVVTGNTRAPPTPDLSRTASRIRACWPGECIKRCWMD